MEEGAQYRRERDGERKKHTRQTKRAVCGTCRDFAEEREERREEAELVVCELHCTISGGHTELDECREKAGGLGGRSPES